MTALNDSRTRLASRTGDRPHPSMPEACLRHDETPNPLFFRPIKDGRSGGCPASGVRGWPRSRSEISRHTLIFGVVAVCLSGCATSVKVPEIPLLEDSSFRAAVREPEPKPSVRYVEVPRPLPLPGQLKPVADASAKPKDEVPPKARVATAHAAARMEPVRDGYINAIQVYPFTVGALYQVYAAVSQVTDIALEAGEKLVAVSAGDTVRWVVGDTTSGEGATAQVHILVKPIGADLESNLVITTDRRTYHLELHSTDKTYMASVSWTYPASQLHAPVGL
jgi:type IV secretion system protein TrbG